MEVVLLYFEDCRSWILADELLAALSAEQGFRYSRRKVDTQAEAAQLGFRGSPSILVDGRDVFARGDEPVGMACRVYSTPDGLAGAPTEAQIRAALGTAARRRASR